MARARPQSRPPGGRVGPAGARRATAPAEPAPAQAQAPASPSRVVATAGHVDHGKSTLVEWLTGTNPDRLEEERRRGLTIDLGFAWTELAGVAVGFVDVPGHVRFLRNMLAGVGAVDACLFVVAATEGWKPQTEDHLRILSLLHAGGGTGTANPDPVPPPTRAVVALTHAAVVPPERLEAARTEVAQRTAGSFLATAPVVAVDVPGGVGTAGPGGLRAVLGTVVSGLPPAPDHDRPRLWIDRAFPMRGAGTVVTGTLTGGRVRVGDHMVLDRGRRGPLDVRVRALETYGQRVREAGPGRRLALNLTGCDHHAAGRGAALTRPGQWHRAGMVDVSLSVLETVQHPVSHRGAYLAYLGTGEQAVRLRVVGGHAIEPGGTGAARLWLLTSLPLLPGDRFVLREAGRRELVGGGEVLDVAPVLPVHRAAPSRSVARVVAERGWVDAAELERLTGEHRPPVLGEWVVDPDALAANRRRVLASVEAAGPSGLDLSTLDERGRAVAATMGELVVTHGIARWAGQRLPGGPGGDPAAGSGAAPGDPAERAGAPPPDADLEEHPYLAALRRAPFTPPPPDGVDRNDLRRLVRSGLVVDVGGVWFAASALAEAAARVATLLEGSPEGVRVSEIRDGLDASRRYVLALLSYFDASGVTRRRGDLRVAGPRLLELARSALTGREAP